MESLKPIARDCLQMLVRGEIELAYEKYFAPEFKHHNEYYAGDRESLKQAMLADFQQKPEKQFTIHQLIEENDTVVTFSHITLQPGEAGMIVVHIMRFNGDKIVEMWDVAQPISANPVNQNGPF